MIEVKEILQDNHFDLPDYNSGNNILIVGSARCGKSYLAEAILEQTTGEFLLITYNWFESKLHLSSSQGIQKISEINSTTKPIITQLILRSNLVIIDDLGFFLLPENSQDYINLFGLALENENINTIIIAQSPNSKSLSKLFSNKKILFDKVLVGKLDYSEVTDPFVKNLRGIEASCTQYFDYISEKRYFMYYDENKFQGIVFAK